MKCVYDINDIWFVILPKNRDTRLIDDVCILNITEYTIKLHILAEKRWDVIETFEKCAVTFVEKLS